MGARISYGPSFSPGVSGTITNKSTAPGGKGANSWIARHSDTARIAWPLIAAIHQDSRAKYFSPRCEQFSVCDALIRCGYMTEPWNVDGVIVARAIAGDRDVLDDILAALQRPLYRYISRLLTNRETAEDVLQEVLFRICRKIVWLRDPELLRPWAFRIASRECFRQLRSEKRRGEETLDLDTLKRVLARASRRNGSPVSLSGWMTCRRRTRRHRAALPGGDEPP